MLIIGYFATHTSKVYESIEHLWSHVKLDVARKKKWTPRFPYRFGFFFVPSRIKAQQLLKMWPSMDLSNEALMSDNVNEELSDIKI